MAKIVYSEQRDRFFDGTVLRCKHSLILCKHHFKALSTYLLYQAVLCYKKKHFLLFLLAFPTKGYVRVWRYIAIVSGIEHEKLQHVSYFKQLITGYCSYRTTTYKRKRVFCKLVDILYPLTPWPLHSSSSKLKLKTFHTKKITQEKTQIMI